MSDAGRLDPASLRLVAITDSLHDGVEGLVARTTAAVAGGVTMVQLRLKDESARTLVEVARRLCAAVPTVPVLVNGRTDVALAAGAAGVHLGLDELAPEVVRRVVPAGFLIGVSADEQVRGPQCAAADYVAVGPVFGVASGRTALGTARLQAIVASCGRPVLAVGGITADNVHEVLATGARGIGMISAVLGASDPSRRARVLRAVLDASER